MKDKNRVARLIIVDDHALVRSGLRSILDEESELEVVGEAKNGREAVEVCRRLCPDLVLMDVRMPEMDGLTATRAVKRECPRASIMMVTLHEDPDYLFEALKSGAAGYVLKDADEDELLSAVRRALDGESPLNPDLATKLLLRLASEDKKLAEPTSMPDRPEKPLPEPLTPRETEVLQLLTLGHTNQQVAQSLVISRGTAKVHVQNIIGKLGVSDRTQAAVRAVELGLVDTG